MTAISVRDLDDDVAARLKVLCRDWWCRAAGSTPVGPAARGRSFGLGVIVIDTDIVSEMMRDEPDAKVLAWPETAGRLHTTAVTLAEVDYGIARLAEGPPRTGWRRRRPGRSPTSTR